MPFEQNAAPPRKIAVIGGGISGLGAADLLAGHHRVTLIEAEPRLGGHARTVMAGKRGDQSVDTGFIVFNRVNYPHIVKLFERLGVPITESSMSFGVSLDAGRWEYCLSDLNGLLATRRNVLDPRFMAMLRDIFRFNARALDLARPGMSIRDLLAQLGTGKWFRDRYLLPFSGAIWSTPAKGILDFPADALLAFFKNHALMGATGQHQWYTVQGGSREYVTRLTRSLEARGTAIRIGTPVQAVRRDALGARVKLHGQDWESFDDVIFATHSDVTLRLLQDANGVERAALSAVKYQPNRAVLHRDTGVMPRRRQCWSSWVYTEDGAGDDRIGLSYWMNSLQPIPQDDPMFVTLNGARAIREELIYDEVSFAHPVYTREALEAQGVIRAINGANNTWFCGAWMKNGFHEDGLASAVDVVEAMALRDQAGFVVAAE
ncbi:Amine oxidase, flavin-containing protein [Candidatus Rhodobacter oscarellae]|uniref:Amine oxidase, flavin-containing protein n=1 Tax=Candidatus Rhodobacter oscarellae TaxID=1675527 RepID=A0A0J9EES9_9RHOB|nr:FAD-dependent oxidoreductase [Candidatus Rhodobacter lobularis]KMW60194.1 Amine oxidase, flavin-containing protein [Candidatus Rhodobacter lobularis]